MKGKFDAISVLPCAPKMHLQRKKKKVKSVTLHYKLKCTFFSYIGPLLSLEI